MKKQKILIILLFFLLQFTLTSIAQDSLNQNKIISLKVDSINIYCKSVDNNKTYVEGISEGVTIDHKGGFDTYFLKDGKKINLFRVKYNTNSENSTLSLTFYYKKNKLVKAIVQSSKTSKEKKVTKNSTIFYLDNDKIIKQFGINSERVNVIEKSKIFLKEFKMK